MISKLRKMSFSNEEDGFTLIELMIVIAVLGILAGIAVPKFTGVQNKARDTSIEAMAGTFRNAMEMYYVESSSYPRNEDLDSMDYSGLIAENILGQYVDLPVQDELPIASSSYDESGDAYVLKIISSATNATYMVGDKGIKETTSVDSDVTSDDSNLSP